MRYDTPVFFVKKAEKQYNPDLGEWGQGESEKVKRYVNKTHMGVERQQKMFGDVKANRFVLRLQRPFTEAYDFIEIDGKMYTVDTERSPSNKQSLVVIQNG